MVALAIGVGTGWWAGSIGALPLQASHLRCFIEKGRGNQAKFRHLLWRRGRVLGASSIEIVIIRRSGVPLSWWHCRERNFLSRDTELVEVTISADNVDTIAWGVVGDGKAAVGADAARSSSWERCFLARSGECQRVLRYAVVRLKSVCEQLRPVYT